MTPRTILYLTPSARLLGARRSLLQLVTHLDPERYRPIVVSQSEGDLVDALRDAGVETHVLFMGWWRKGRYMLMRPLRVRQLAALARKTGADLLHCNEFFPCPYAVRAAKKAGDLPVVSHMRLSISERRIRNYDLRRTARVVCVSEAAASDFHIWPDWRERVVVIYNGVDLSEYQIRPSRADARAKWGLSPEDFVVGQFALISPRKQQHLLVQAAALLKSDVPNLRLLIVGSGGKSDAAYEQEVKQIAEESGLGDRVRFIPFQKDILDLYQACDFNALISNDEGFGRTIIEAGALNVPSIGTRIGGIPELIVDGETGRLISGDDDGGKALADSLRTLAANPEQCQAMGLAACRRVEENFTIESHVEKVMALYDELLTK